MLFHFTNHRWLANTQFGGQFSSGFTFFHGILNHISFQSQQFSVQVRLNMFVATCLFSDTPFCIETSCNKAVQHPSFMPHPIAEGDKLSFGMVNLVFRT